MMVLMIRCVLYPKCKLFVTSGGKEQAAGIMKEKVQEICTLIPAFNKEIDWSRGKPYTWTKVDLDELMESDRFFARKFSENDMEIVQLIKRKISNTK